MTPPEAKSTQEARKIIFQYALFRVENAILIAGAILLTWLFPRPFPWWPVWGGVLLALIGVAGIFFSSLGNARDNSQFLLKQFQGQFDLRKIKQAELRRDVELALEYQRRIEDKVRRQHASLLWDRPEETANQLTEWVTNIYQLALRLDAYRRDMLLEHESQSVPQELDSLVQRRKRETNPDFQKEFDQVIETKKKQWEALRALAARMKQAELQLAQSLAALATVNSQVQLIEAQDAEGGRSQRIQGDIQEQVNRLHDLVSSINEVYDYHTPGLG